MSNPISRLFYGDDEPAPLVLDSTKAQANADAYGMIRDLINKARSGGGRTFRPYTYGTGTRGSTTNMVQDANGNWVVGSVTQAANRPPVRGDPMPNAMPDGGSQNMGGSTNINTGSRTLDAYSASGNAALSGGYDPIRKSIAFEQMTRGLDSARDDAVNKMREAYSGRGLLRSSAAMGAEGRVRAAYDDQKANALGKVVLADLNQADRHREMDINRQNTIEDKNIDDIYETIRLAQGYGSGDPYTAASRAQHNQSMADAERNNQEEQAWWNIAGLFF